MSGAQRDWVASYRTCVIAWGIPAVAFVGAIFVPPPAKTVIWIVALIWMGAACVLNARRCSRTHCYFTAPFFLVMTVPVALHGFDILSFGPGGWNWLGNAIGIGAALLWCLPEHFLGTYVERKGTTN